MLILKLFSFIPPMMESKQLFPFSTTEVAKLASSLISSGSLFHKIPLVLVVMECLTQESNVTRELPILITSKEHAELIVLSHVAVMEFWIEERNVMRHIEPTNQTNAELTVAFHFAVMALLILEKNAILEARLAQLVTGSVIFCAETDLLKATNSATMGTLTPTQIHLHATPTALDHTVVMERSTEESSVMMEFSTLLLPGTLTAARIVLSQSVVTVSLIPHSVKSVTMVIVTLQTDVALKLVI